jgi:integrase
MRSRHIGPRICRWRVGFVFVTDAGHPIRRTAFGDMASRRQGCRAPHGTGFHELRHYYASLLIRHSESVKVVQARLGPRVRE